MAWTTYLTEYTHDIESGNHEKIIKIVSYQKGCGDAAFNQSNILACDSFIYDLQYFDETLATLHDLVCNEEYKTQLLNR